ncbi:MAG: hypothetical protein Tsb0017_24150 [Geothermobacteraceae bacterium]
MLQNWWYRLRRERLLLLISLLAGGWYFWCGWRRTDPELFSPSAHLGFSALFALGILLAGHLFLASLHAQLAREIMEHEGEPPGRLVRLFLFYRELIKTVIGTSMTLAWMAGVVFILDNLVDYGLVVSLLAALVYSLVLLGCMRLLVLVVDNIRIHDA